MSGAGTNSGINYQQRIAALALVAQYTDFDLSSTFSISQKLEIESIHFETDDPIDDLKIKCKGCILFLQIKRTLSLQVDIGTDFYKTMNQFVSQFIKNKNKQTKEYYILATSTTSSSPITQELCKITESIRLNDNAFKDNPLNKSENETFKKFKTLFLDLYKKQSGKDAIESNFIAFSKQIYISILDIEHGRPNEQVAIILLKDKKLIDPSLVWNTLIANSLEYARKRQSISKDAIENLLNRYIITEEDTNLDEFDIYFKTEIINNGQLPVAKEVLLIESFDDDNDYLIIELFRFSDDSKIKHEFQGNKIKLEGLSDTLKVIQRFATLTGLIRFLDENEHICKNKKVSTILSNPKYEIQESENTSIAELHRQYLQELATKNINFLKCLHCDKAIDPTNSIIVEIDDIDSNLAMGAIHPKCLRPIDRIIGLLNNASVTNKGFLKSFDYKSWARLMMKGQGLMNGLKSSSHIQETPYYVVAWSPNEKEFRDFSYCINFILANGSSVLMKDRGRIHRFNKPEAEYKKNKWIESLKINKQKNDPLCFTNKIFIFGNRSRLLRLKNDDEIIIEIETIEVTRYSKLLEKRDENIYFYAPICIPRHTEEETLINLGKIIPLISDPLSFEKIYNSWKNIGFKLLPQDIELKIIKSDLEFDSYMREFFATGFLPIIAPIFNKGGDLTEGVEIQVHSNEGYGEVLENPK